MQFYNFNKNGNEFDATCFDHLNEAKNAFKKCLEFSVNKFDENQQIEVDPVGTLFYNLAVGNLALVYYFSQEYEDARHYYEKVCIYKKGIFVFLAPKNGNKFRRLCRSTENSNQSGKYFSTTCQAN